MNLSLLVAFFKVVHTYQRMDTASDKTSLKNISIHTCIYVYIFILLYKLENYFCTIVKKY